MREATPIGSSFSFLKTSCILATVFAHLLGSPWSCGSWNAACRSQSCWYSARSTGAEPSTLACTHTARQDQFCATPKGCNLLYKATRCFSGLRQHTHFDHALQLRSSNNTRSNGCCKNTLTPISLSIGVACLLTMNNMFSPALELNGNIFATSVETAPRISAS